MFINGQYVAARSSDRIALTNPATEAVFDHVADGNEADVDAAVGAARAAAADWKATPPADRAAIIDRIADGIVARAAEMDALVTKENGAPAWWAGYVGSGSQFLYRNAAHLARTIEFEVPRQTNSGRSIYRHEPIGVVAAIAPWNSPQVLLASKIGPALAAGCPVVVKPSPETGLDGLMLGEIAQEAGVPAGVLNIVNGGRVTGAALVAHAGIDMVSFTGSTAAGRAIASVCGQQLKKVSAELGGKSAAIVLDDTDIEVFAKSIISDVMPYSGQVCYTTSRIIVHRSRHDEVLECLRSVLAAAQVGDPTDPATLFGPLITTVQRDKVEGYIRSGVAEGARLVLGGGRPKGLDRGYFVEPTIFVDVDPRMKIYQEEIFGPVVGLTVFDTDDEAVALHNDSEYGLSGAIFGGDLDRVNAVARRLDTGRIIVNNAKGASRYSCLMKTSGLGNVGDMETLDTFLQMKNITQPV